MCTVLNLSTWHRLLHQSFSLRDLSLWVALSMARVDLNLPTRYMLLASAFVAATLLPGALSARALCPLFVLNSQELGHQLLPAFTDYIKVLWDSQF